MLMDQNEFSATSSSMTHLPVCCHAPRHDGLWSLILWKGESQIKSFYKVPWSWHFVTAMEPCLQQACRALNGLHAACSLYAPVLTFLSFSTLSVLNSPSTLPLKLFIHSHLSVQLPIP